MLIWTSIQFPMYSGLIKKQKIGPGGLWSTFCIGQILWYNLSYYYQSNGSLHNVTIYISCISIPKTKQQHMDNIMVWTAVICKCLIKINIIYTNVKFVQISTVKCLCYQLNITKIPLIIKWRSSILHITILLHLRFPQVNKLVLNKTCIHNYIN